MNSITPLQNEAEVPSPALLIYPDLVEENLRRMIALVGGDASRLRPHIKTHKLPQIIRQQAAMGITKCKCATIAEAEMAAENGATDILVAQQPVGPNIERLICLQRTYPKVAFSTIVDSVEAARAISTAAEKHGTRIEAMIDLEIGQRRTGILPDAQAIELYREICTLPGLKPGGLHAYDGHLHQKDEAERAAASDAAYGAVPRFKAELEALGFPVPRVVVGGTPTFPMHAKREGIECSPGTCVLWDAGYGTMVPDLRFENAAVLLTRVISKAQGRICLDLGHKAVAAENPHPRVIFPDLPDAKAVVHSEEHLVLETARAADIPLGTALYGIPWHVCPTVALHSDAQVVRDGRVVETWPVLARTRRITI